MKNDQKNSQSKSKKDGPTSYLTRYRQSTQVERQSKLNSLVKATLIGLNIKFRNEQKGLSRN